MGLEISPVYTIQSIIIIRLIIERIYMHSVHAQDKYTLNSQQCFKMIFKYALNSCHSIINGIIVYWLMVW